MKVAPLPKFRGTELSIIEVTESVGFTDPGIVQLDEYNHLIPPSIFYFEPGNIIGVSLVCDNQSASMSGIRVVRSLSCHVALIEHEHTSAPWYRRRRTWTGQAPTVARP